MRNLKQHDMISSQQLFFILNGTVLGIGIIYDPSSLISIMKQNAWMAPLIGGAIMLLDIYLITALASRYPQLQLAEYSNLILGRYLGKLPTLIFILYTISIVGAEYQLVATIAYTFLLPNTPLVIARVVTALMLVYAVTGGFDSVARLNQVLIWALVTGLLLFIPTIFLFDLTNLLPLGHIPLSSIMHGTLHIGFSLVGAELLLVWFPQIRPQIKVRKAALWAYSSVIAVYLCIFVLVILTIGPAFAPVLVWAPLSLLKMIDIAALGRMDFYAFLLLLMISFRPMVNYLHAGTVTLKSLIKPLSFTWCAFLLMALAFGITFIPRNIHELLQYTEYVGWLGLSIAFVLPVLLLSIDILRHGWRYRYEN
ncbi:MAG: GerAB/ArcD/ProY family transporter [Methylocystaceae bacterium]